MASMLTSSILHMYHMNRLLCVFAVLALPSYGSKKRSSLVSPCSFAFRARPDTTNASRVICVSRQDREHTPDGVVS